MTELTTLKTLCDELKVSPREARTRLRAAVKDTKNFPVLTKAYKPGSLWQWPKGSDAEAEARKAVQAEPPVKK
jgi:hypothetical protein